MTYWNNTVMTIYFQVERYDFKRGGHQAGTGHFTQVIWKDSKELGMARAKSSDGSVYVVARYRPAGNMLNSFNDNVVPKVRWANNLPSESDLRLW